MGLKIELVVFDRVFYPKIEEEEDKSPEEAADLLLEALEKAAFLRLELTDGRFLALNKGALTNSYMVIEDQRINNG